MSLKNVLLKAYKEKNMVLYKHVRKGADLNPGFLWEMLADVRSNEAEEWSRWWVRRREQGIFCHLSGGNFSQKAQDTSPYSRLAQSGSHDPSALIMVQRSGITLKGFHNLSLPLSQGVVALPCYFDSQHLSRVDKKGIVCLLSNQECQPRLHFLHSNSPLSLSTYRDKSKLSTS